ncbi:GNAT family N-acetyltransferase [Paraburkholderia xenovorans]|uniref:GNAT family N-acetyltransferase n=1 Tax=Paraburkholderia xenovorans TaxID=36873 RepID=UPI0038BAB6A8
MAQAPAPMKRPGIHGAAPTAAPARTAGTAPAAAKSKWDGRPVLVDAQSWFTLSHKFQMNMQRFRGTDRGASAEKVLSEHMTGDQKHVYMLDGGKPVGVMTSHLLTDGSVHVNGVVTHPGSKGVGGALIEGAVNTSVKNGGSGMVHLQYLDQASRAAYSKLGFRFEGGSGVNMILVPAARPDLWERTDEGYRLKKPAPKMT